MRKNGQAVVEFVVALIPLLVIVAGLIQIGMINNVHNETMAEARRKVADRVIKPTLGHAAHDYYREWTDGKDGVSYSADDEAEDGNVRTLRDALAIPAHPEELEEKIGENLVSDLMIDPYLILWGLEEGTHEETVTVLPITRSLFYAGEGIEVRSEVWMPAIGDGL